MKKAIFIVAALALSLCAEAKTKEATVTVTEVGADDDASNNGVTYCLPITSVCIRIDAELTTEKVGPYYKYSNKYLNLSNVVTEDKQEWRIVGAEIVGTQGKADPDKRYKISTDGAQMPAVALGVDGLLLGVNLTENQNVSDVYVKSNNNYVATPVVDFDDVKHEKNVLLKTSTAAMAEESANAIYRLREKRLQLLGGDEAVILHDEGSYNRVLAELDSLEAQYVSLFAGKKQTVKVSRYFVLTPDNQGSTSTVITRFSATEGFVDAMNLNGKPVYVDVAFAKQQRLSSLPAESKQRQENPVTGLRYVVPASVNVKVIDRNTLLCEGNIFCAQSGQIVTLPASILLNSNATIIFAPENGALKSISYK